MTQPCGTPDKLDKREEKPSTAAHAQGLNKVPDDIGSMFLLRVALMFIFYSVRQGVCI